jgi:phthiocerol/phenolphthiocerol synthesis type-I polyketide synthase B
MDAMAVLAVATLWMGVYPKPFTDVMNSSVAELLSSLGFSRALAALEEEVLADAVSDAGAGGDVAEGEFRKALRECPSEQRRALLAEHVGGLASAVMGLPPSEILDPAAGFFQLGMDSLMSVTLSRSLSASLGETLTPAVVFDYPSVEALSDYLSTVLPELADAHEAGGDEYDDLTDDDLLRQLSERLGQAN